MHPPDPPRRAWSRGAGLLLLAVLVQACGGGSSRTTGPTTTTSVVLPVRGIKATQLPANCTGLLTASGPGPSQSVPLPPLEATLSLPAGVWTLGATITCGGQTATGSTTVTVVPPNPLTVIIQVVGVQSTLTVTKIGSGTVTGPGISCGGQCLATYTIGTVVTLTASPDPGFVFIGWSGPCGGTGTCTLTITSSPVSVTATFGESGPSAPPGNIVIAVTKAGTGSGTVTSAPASINCGPTCSAALASSTVITLTAAPAAGSIFAGWSGGGCSGTGTCTVTLTASVTVTATFTTAPTGTFPLTVTPAGTGSGTVTSVPAGVNCGATCSAAFGSGTVVTLTAAPAAGSVFAGWSGGGCSGTGTCTVTLTAGVTVTATFNVPGITLTVVKAGTGSGTVTSAPAGVNCGATCSAAFGSGTVVTLTAAPAAGSVFAGWSGGGCSGTGTCTVTLTAAVTVTATFNIPTITLTVTKAGTGSGTVTSAPGGINCGATCSAAFGSGTVVTLTAAPAAGSVFAGWSGGGCSGLGTCTVTLTAAVTVTATFEIPGTITINNLAGSTLSGVTITGPFGLSFGPFTIGSSSAQTINGVIPGAYTAPSGTYYAFASACPAFPFSVPAGGTVTINYNEIFSSPTNSCTVF